MNSLGPQIPIIVFADTMIYRNQRSGGDRIFVDLSRYLSQEDYSIRVLTTPVGQKLWEKSGSCSKIVTLHSFAFEQLIGRGTVPIVYLFRAILGLVNAIKIMPVNQKVVLYSSSDFIPDVIPPFLLSLVMRNSVWISRVYHIVAPPSSRKGGFVINLMSFASQRASLTLMKKRASLVIGLNPVVRHELATLGISESRLATSGAGIDFEHIDAVGSNGEKRYDGVFLGRIHPNKGIFDTLEIWRVVIEKSRNARLAIIGGGE